LGSAMVGAMERPSAGCARREEKNEERRADVRLPLRLARRRSSVPPPRHPLRALSHTPHTPEMLASRTPSLASGRMCGHRVAAGARRRERRVWAGVDGPRAGARSCSCAALPRPSHGPHAPTFPSIDCL
jgi:hypothetical protein